ncbi:MAG: RDD family protein [Campylobacterota bacterium]
MRKKKRLPPRSEAPKTAFAPFRSRALGFMTDIFMIGLPISLLVSAFFGYDQMHTAGGLDVIVADPKARTNPPDPIASAMQMGLFLIAYVWFWHRSGQTPGKKLARIRVVDARTLQNAPYWKLILRFVGYFVSALTLFGFFVGFLRKDGRALHDLLSGTAVIRES